MFAIGGEIKVNRLGFGAMQITGRGVWGPPRDKAEAIRVLKPAITPCRKRVLNSVGRISSI